MLGGRVCRKAGGTYADTGEVSPLSVGVNVHLDDAVLDSSLDLVLGGTGTTMEDEEEGLLFLATELPFGVGLMLVEQLGVEADVSGLVHAVNVAEGGGDGEVGGDGRESGVDVPNVLGLGVEARIVDVGIVDTVLLAAGDANLHLEPDAKGSHALEVLDAVGDVVLLGLFGEVEHMGGKEGLLMLLEIVLVCFEHAIEPGEKLLGAVV